MANGCIIMHESLSAQEMELVNAKIASAAVSGKLEQSPLIQGILCRLIGRLDKRSRGMNTEHGRTKACSETETRLLEGAASTLAVLGASTAVCSELGQRKTKERVDLDTLLSMGVPNPCLTLLYQSQLEENLIVIDQAFPGDDKIPARRLVLGLDCTYLTKSMCQHRIRETAGLVGAPYSTSNPGLAFTPISKRKSSLPKAPLMLEMLMWDPNHRSKVAFSLGGMPVSLSAPQIEGETNAYSGNWEPW